MTFGNLRELNLFYENLSRRGAPDMRLDFVYGDGPCDADVILIGEAPGKDEVLQGRPFVGKAGSILDEILLKTGINRNRLYITNAIKYRLMKEGSRPGSFKNRPATMPEIRAMLPWLKEEICFIRPKLILTLGNVPLKSLCFASGCGILEIGSCHGKAADVRVDSVATGKLDTKLVPLYHPASQIYNRSLKDVFDADFQAVRELLLFLEG